MRSRSSRATTPRARCAAEPAVRGVLPAAGAGNYPCAVPDPAKEAAMYIGLGALVLIILIIILLIILL